MISGIKTLYKKELDYFLNNAVGYIVIALFAVTANFLFVRDIFVAGTVSLKSFFSLLPWLFLIFIPALTMRSFSEEKRANTIEVLLTMPVSETQIVAAKFLAYLSLTALALALTFSLPISFYLISRVHFPEIAVGYMGSLFLAALYIAVSLFFSSQTKNQIVALLLSVAVIFVMIGITSELFTSLLPKIMQDLLTFFGPLYHFQGFVKGVFDLRSFYFLTSATLLFLFLTVIHIERRD